MSNIPDRARTCNLRLRRFDLYSGLSTSKLFYHTRVLATAALAHHFPYSPDFSAIYAVLQGFCANICANLTKPLALKVEQSSFVLSYHRIATRPMIAFC